MMFISLALVVSNSITGIYNTELCSLALGLLTERYLT